MLNLGKEMQRLKEVHLKGAGGRQVTSQITKLIDQTIVELWAELGAEKINEEIALIAIGGYGRREMSFFSDVDLLILHKENVSESCRGIIEDFVQRCWDCKLNLDHSFRTIEECLQVAQEEFSALMSMLTHRFLIGNKDLFEKFQNSLKGMIGIQSKAILKRLYSEYQKRHRHYNQHIYLLEPHIKEGIGGLRDYHTILWIGLLCYQTDSLEALCKKGILLRKEKEDLEKATDFLWEIRNYLHYLSGREDDELSFGQQEKICQLLKVEPLGHLKPIEVFMRSFFKHSFNIKHITYLIFARVLHKSVSKDTKEKMEAVYFENGKIEAKNPKIFFKEPVLILKVYRWALAYGATIGISIHSVMQDINQSLGGWFSLNPKAQNAFIEFLNQEGNLLPYLEDMTYQGLLCSLIPEWNYILHLPQHNIYHIYTVDLHSFHTLQEIKQLQKGEYKNKFPVFTAVSQEIGQSEVLFLAALFHDLGKGLGHPHTDTGAKATREILAKWQMEKTKAEDIIWLVKNHLLLSHIAQRRDLDDEKVIIDTAQKIGDITRLKYLYILSFADAKATGPRAFTEWKMSLITELFFKVKQILEGKEFGKKDTWQRLERVKTELIEKIEAKFHEKPNLESLPQRYLLNTPVSDIINHYGMAKGLYHRPAVFLWEENHTPSHFKLTIATWDFLGLLAKITGVLSLHQFDIFNVQAYTWDNKIALDTFWVKTNSLYEIEERKRGVENDLCRAIEGDLNLKESLKSRCRPSLLHRKDLPSPQSEIKIDNKSSYFYTIIEVFTPDKPCLLFKLAQCLAQLKVNIHLAKVSTSLDYAVDVFYVQEKDGEKIEDKARIEQIRHSLKKVILE